MKVFRFLNPFAHAAPEQYLLYIVAVFVKSYPFPGLETLLPAPLMFDCQLLNGELYPLYITFRALYWPVVSFSPKVDSAPASDTRSLGSKSYFAPVAIKLDPWPTIGEVFVPR